MATPHIAAGPGEIAPSVIMPGDPLRARRIAEQLLDAPRLVTDVRGILGFTGTRAGRPLTVMASGMGAPSMMIYATELYRCYGVERIVRVGTAGAIADDLALGQVVVASAAHTDSGTATVRVPGVTLSLAATPHLLHAALLAADTDVRVGPVLSSDHFYGGRADLTTDLAGLGTLAVEMEAAGLYATALQEGGEALAVLTVSDRAGQAMTVQERETSYGRAVALAVRAIELREAAWERCWRW